jgi:hypothetical protein
VYRLRIAWWSMLWSDSFKKTRVSILVPSEERRQELEARAS